ncbi:hypothetical protein CARUB_v10005932mg [Capsella rubella]|uniref:Uncharacterized protein n=3 Tax=Capsella rubella TaxID=81985 RepID=R0F7M5_9BRAS|nr:hypothetical protein CARUB_v10005932mg [Capsella rubella]
MSNLESLVTLKLSGCSELEDIDDFPENLKEIFLAGTVIRKLPSSIVDLSELAILDLKNCKRLRDLPEGMVNLNPLEVLDLSYCSELKVCTSSLPQAKDIRQYRKVDMTTPATENEPQQTLSKLDIRYVVSFILIVLIYVYFIKNMFYLNAYYMVH